MADMNGKQLPLKIPGEAGRFFWGVDRGKAAGMGSFQGIFGCLPTQELKWGDMLEMLIYLL